MENIQFLTLEQLQKEYLKIFCELQIANHRNDEYEEHMRNIWNCPNTESRSISPNRIPPSFEELKDPQSLVMTVDNKVLKDVLMEEVQTKSIGEVKKKLMDKVNLNHFTKILMEKPEEINSSKTFLEYAAEYNIDMDKQTNNFSVKNFMYALITINPPEDKEWADIEPFVKKLIEQDIVADAMWCYEQRSEELEPKGFHCHIFINRKTGNKNYMENKKLRMKCRTVFRKLWPEDVGPSFSQLNIKYVKAEHKERYIAYLLGNKKKDEKTKKKRHEMDVILRKELGYEPLYRKGSI